MSDHMNQTNGKTRKYDRANVEDSMSNEESPRVSEEDEPNKVPKAKDSKGASFYQNHHTFGNSAGKKTNL